MRTIYLDSNGTTPIAPRVREAMLPFIAEHCGNPSSRHILGRIAHEAVEDARSRVASLLGAEREEIVFTSGGTESNNLALKGVALRQGLDRPGHLVISAIEHPSVSEPAAFLRRLGFELSVIRCGKEGVVDPADVAATLRGDTLLVSIMTANNEIGTIQPIREIAAICRARHVPIHTDAAQAAGKIDARVEDLDVDLLTIAGHKMYAPKGVGALYVRRGTLLEPLLHGAGQEAGLRAGTENVAQLVALGEAANLARQNLVENGRRMKFLRDRLWHRLRDGVGDALILNGDGASLLPNTLSVSFPSVRAAELLARTPEICASTGSACHSGSTHSSPTLKAMGVDADVAQGSVRLSVGWYSTEEEIDKAAELLLAAWEALR